MAQPQATGVKVCRKCRCNLELSDLEVVWGVSNDLVKLDWSPGGESLTKAFTKSCPSCDPLRCRSWWEIVSPIVYPTMFVPSLWVEDLWSTIFALHLDLHECVSTWRDCGSMNPKVLRSFGQWTLEIQYGYPITEVRDHVAATST